MEIDAVSSQSIENLKDAIFRRAAEIRRDWGMEPQLIDQLQTEELSVIEEITEVINPEIMDDDQAITASAARVDLKILPHSPARVLPPRAST